MKNHYEILGLSPSANREEIKTAYRKLSVKFHPDNNNGDQYFTNMFRQIQEAYTTLSDDDRRREYDRNMDFEETSLATSRPKPINQSPVITYFETDKDSFEEGETIKLSWRTANADKVIIKPFGEVEKTGTKIFKPKNFNKKFLTLSLEATNSLFDESLTKTLKIKNLVTEVDFSEMEEEKTREPEIEKEQEQPVVANSIAFAEEETSVQTEVYTESFFSIRGRLRRSTYIGRAILLAIPGVLLSAAAESSYDDSLLGFAGLILIAGGILIFMQFIKRLHDINLSGWYGLINLIPYLGGLFGLVVVFIDGTKGPNKYGPDPKNRTPY